MTHGSIHQGGQGSATERRLQSAPAPCGVARGSTAFVTRVRPLRAPSLSIPGRSRPARAAGRSHRGYGADHPQASTQHSESTAEICEQQRPHHRSNRGTRLKRVSRCSEKAWLSRSAEAAHCKSKSTMRLIACANPSSPRPIVFWCPVGSVRWVNT